MKSKKGFLPVMFWVLALLGVGPVQGQATRQLTLEAVWQQALDHYPLSRQRDLLRQTEQITLANLNRSYLPQVVLSGQATYQSEVTQIVTPLPEFQIQPLSKDQYKVMADVSQVI